MKVKNTVLTDGSREDLISMVLGLIIVGVVIGLVFNFVQKRRGSISVPGVSNQIALSDEVVTNGKTVSDFYKVKKGDNLWDIAVKIYGNGYKWVDIAKINNLADANLLVVGQELNLLSNGAVSKPSGEYIVRRGDNLWKISIDLYGDGFKWVDIWNQNKPLIFDPDVVEVGTKLALP